MIDDIFNILISDHLNPYLINKAGSPPNTTSWITACNIAETAQGNADTAKGTIVMSLVNIEEDRVYKVNETRFRPASSIGLSLQKPPVYLNLSILFASHFENDTLKYQAGLKMLSLVIQFFQHQNVFTPQNSPSLSSVNIEELIFELRTLSFQDLNNLWGVLGSRYMPSVLYKVRMLVINEDFSEGAAPVIQHIAINDSVIQ